MSFKKNQLLVLLFSIGVLFSCKKDKDPAVPGASFSASKLTVVVDEEIQFTNNSTNATAFKWSFGDGTTSTDAAQKAYATSNNFSVSLVATGEGGSNTSTVDVKVLPFGAFTVENEGNLTASAPVQFTNGSKGATSYLWSFGDAANSTSTAASPTFTYPAGGTFTVTLKSISAVGETVSTKTVTVAGAPVVKELYFIEYGNTLIKKLAVSGSSATSDVLDIAGKAGPGMAIDEANGHLYFSDFEVTGTGNIWKMNLDGTGLTAIVSGLTDPYGIALDLAGGKIYWADDLGNISRANLDGSGQQIGIVNIPGGGMRAVALDPANDKMYFYEVQAEILYVAKMDGSNPQPLLTGTYGYAILVDTVNGKIYYDDQNAKKLFRVNLDGTGQTTIDASGSRIYGIAIDQSDGKLYWSGRDSGNITRANLDGTASEALATGLLSPRGIALKK